MFFHTIFIFRNVWRTDPISSPFELGLYTLYMVRIIRLGILIFFCIIFVFSGEDLKYSIDEDTGYGSRLDIELPVSCASEFKVLINYSTVPESPALQWMSPQQTAGGTQPYVFSMCQVASF